MAVHFKTYINDVKEASIKRFSLKNDELKCFYLFQETINQLYPEFKIITIKYKDCDDDLVTISSHSDLHEALNLLPNDTIKLFLTGKRLEVLQDCASNKSDVKDIREEAKKDDPNHVFVHPNIICDGCDSLIYGIRYKCSVCYDYDLCASCEQQKLHIEHPLLKIYKPIKKFYNNFNFADYQNETPSNKFKSHYGNETFIPTNYNHENITDSNINRQNSFDKKNDDSQTNMFPFGTNYWNTFLKNLGQGLNTLFDPLGIDVNVDMNGYNHSGSTQNSHKFNTRNKYNSFKASTSTAEKASQNECFYDESHTRKTNLEHSSPINSPDSLRDLLQSSSGLFTPNIKININGTDVLSTSFSKFIPNEKGNDENMLEKGEEVFVTQEGLNQSKGSHCEKEEQEVDAEKVDKKLTSKVDLVKTDDIPFDKEKLIEDIAEPRNKDLNKYDIPQEFTTWDLLEQDDTQSIDSNTPFEKIENTFEDSLKQLEAMGYVNEGGWLAYLLKIKNGDVSKVLDIIHPN